MRYSKLFGKTKHEVPCDSNSKNAELLTKGGFIDKLSSGIYSFLPLGLRVLKKINEIIREEMDAIDGQEILMPALHPIDIWKTTGRDITMNDIFYKTKAGEKEFVFGPSHEETVTPLVKKFVQSYKDLPLSVYQLQTKFRNEPRAKSGLLRGREFGMKDMYSFHTSEEDLDNYYKKAIEAYLNVYRRAGVEAYVLEASGGAFSDKYSHEFSIITDAGEDTMILCKNCKFAQNLEIAEGKYENPSSNEEEKPLEKVEIERGKSVSDNAKAHNVDDWRILKSVVYMIEDEGPIGVLIRGDFKVNEDKLQRYFKKKLRPLTSDELEKYGLIEGFISPIGENGQQIETIEFVGDNSIKEMKNFVTGANKINVDWKGANIGRDFQVKDFADFVAVGTSFKCPKCDHELTEEKAVEAGNIFKLGTKFSEAFDLKYTDSDGVKKTVIMGCYGIGNTRLLGTIVEASHDENGIIWPKSVAPYLVNIIRLGDEAEVTTMTEKIYKSLLEKNIDTLLDDRDIRAGEKFKDADLIGIPLRIVISKRTIGENSVEWKERTSTESHNVKIEDLIEKIIEFANK
ncbi:proline--tRNA ligase [Patescibacteria group bacterium]|nr:proline--tRNA ligase [Patescibacteria group bacterium]